MQFSVGKDCPQQLLKFYIHEKFVYNVYVTTKLGISCLSLIIPWLLAGSEWILPTASQHKCMTYTSCYIYRVIPPDDEQ